MMNQQGIDRELITRKLKDLRGEFNGLDALAGAADRAKQNSLYALQDACRAGDQALQLCDEAERMISVVASQGRSVGEIDSGSCTLSNLKGPVILLVYEQKYLNRGSKMWWSWYKYYTPSNDTQEWTLE